MRRITIYPNNDVDIDGKGAHWEEAELVARNIALVRTSGHMEYAERVRVGEELYIVFPNHYKPPGKGSNHVACKK